MSSIKHKIPIIIFFLAGIILLISPMQNHVRDQYSDQGNPNVASLEEELAKAKEKIRQAQSAGAYGSGTGLPISNPINAISDFFNNFLNIIGLSMPGFTKYTDPSGSISFQYPSDWVKMSEVNLSNFGTSFGSPLENDQRSVFTLAREDTDFLFLDTYKDFHTSELQNTNFFGYGFSDIEGPVDTTLAGMPAFKIQYVSPVLGGLDTIEITTLKDGKLYTASFQGKPESFQKNLDNYNKILSTINIK